MVGLAGEGQNFDGNGAYVRFQPGGGSQTVSLGDAAGAAPAVRQRLRRPLGTRPAYPGQAPPYTARRPVLHEPSCPNVNGPAGRAKAGTAATTATPAATRERRRR